MTNNQNTHRDITQPEEHPQRNGADIVQPADVLEKIAILQNAIDRHEPITLSMINDLRHAFAKVEINVAGNVPMHQLQNDSEVRNNMEIWREIMRGDFTREEQITSLTDDVAKAIAHDPNADWIFLKRLTRVTDEQIRILAEFQGKTLYLGIPHLTDRQVRLLAGYGGTLILQVIQITDEQAELLAHCNAKELILENLTHLTDKAAAFFGTFAGDVLLMSNISSLSDKAAEALAPIWRKIDFHVHAMNQVKDAASRLGLT